MAKRRKKKVTRKPTLKEITAELKAQVCNIVADGHTLTKACKDLGIQPMRLGRVISDDAEFGKELRIAMHMGSHSHVGKAWAVARQCLNHELDAHQARVVLDFHKWMATKLANGTYADIQKVGDLPLGQDGVPPVLKFEIIKACKT